MVMAGFPILVVLVTYAVRTECGHLPTAQCNTLFRSLGHRGRSHYFYSSKAVGWHEANRTCHSFQDTHLANIPDEDTLYFITERAAPVIGRIGEKTSFWFGAHEVTFRQWRWLDDEIYNGSMIDYGAHTKKTCGLVDGTKVDHLAYGTCAVKKRFLCVNPDAGLNDLAVNDYYIATTAEPATWFKARESCLCRGMDLAMAKVGSVDYMYGLLNGSTDHFWIGLQKARFVWESTGEVITYLPFRPNQPDDWRTVEDCLHMFEAEFNDIHCTAKYGFVCEWEDTSVEVTNMASQVQPEPAMKEAEVKLQRENTGEADAKQPQREKAGDAGIMVGLSVLVVVGVIALTLVLVVLKADHGNTGNQWQQFGNNGEDEGM